ncbi:hypothetical protein HAX54_045556 [Datura stramonium]|uniref:Uncharacterized protein n=1 Tax=Datura stramonium TaxID=4076 RepID=A0ABS8WHS6_DATST|nr:hypothetical protein [Datura stramonium]
MFSLPSEADVFRKFTDDQGDFKKTLVNDVQGMLSLYEAAQFRVHGEQILDEAAAHHHPTEINFAQISNSLAQQVSSALKFPIRDGGGRVEIMKRLPYARDRLVELYFWSLGIYFEPQYSVARKIVTKFVFCSIMDDTYDTYGTLDELTLLQSAIERWNIDASEKLPPYMKIIYRALLDVYNEIEQELANENKSFLVNYSINEMKKLSRAYFQEAKWYHGKNVPTVEQYVKNGGLSSTYHLIAASFLLGMERVATKDAFDWIATEPLHTCCFRCHCKIAQ